MSFIAGAYTATLGGSTLGQIEAGFTLDFSFMKRIITGDTLAESPQDAVFRGAQASIQYTLLEYNALAALSAMFPYGSVFLNMSAPVGVIDVTSSKHKQLILTAVTGTPAAVALGPATMTLPRCILAPNFPVNLLFAPDLRTVPIRQQIYPDSSGVFGTIT